MSKRITEPGRYRVSVMDAGFNETSKGTEYLEVVFTTADGLEISKRYWLTTGAFQYTAENLVEVFGFNGDFDSVVDQLLEKECEITVEEQKDENDEIRTNKNGDPYMEVKWVNRIRELKKESRPDLNSRFARLGINVNNKPAHQRTPNDASRPRTGGQKSGGNPW